MMLLIVVLGSYAWVLCLRDSRWDWCQWRVQAATCGI